MEEEPLTPQVLSSAISSICAVISNYWSLIEVHVEYSPPLSLSLSRQMNTRHSPITQSDTPGDPTCHLNLPFQPHSFLSSNPPQFEKTAGTLWCLTGLALGHIHCCIWQGIYSCYSQDAEIIFYMAPCSKYLSWASFTASWHLKTDSSHLENQITEMLRLFGPLDTFFYICQKDPLVLFGYKKKSLKISALPGVTSICSPFLKPVYYNFEFYFCGLVIIYQFWSYATWQGCLMLHDVATTKTLLHCLYLFTLNKTLVA